MHLQVKEAADEAGVGVEVAAGVEEEAAAAALFGPTAVAARSTRAERTSQSPRSNSS